MHVLTTIGPWDPNLSVTLFDFVIIAHVRCERFDLGFRLNYLTMFLESSLARERPRSGGSTCTC